MNGRDAQKSSPRALPERPRHEQGPMSRVRKTGPELRCCLSGRPDLNRRPLDPQQGQRHFLRWAVWLLALVSLWALVGGRRRERGRIARSSPRSLPTRAAPSTHHTARPGCKLSCLVPKERDRRSNTSAHQLPGLVDVASPMRAARGFQRADEIVPQQARRVLD
jgi:hypothetical protein